MAEDLSHRIQDLEERNRRLEETLRQMRLDWEIISASAFANSAQYDEGVGIGGTPLGTGSLGGDEGKPGGEIDLSVLDSHIADGTEKKLVGKSLDYQATDLDVAPALELHGFSAVGAPGAPTPPQFVFGEKEGADDADGSRPMGLLDPDGKSTSDPKSKWFFAVYAPSDGTSPPELRWVKINLDDLPAQDVEIVGGNKIDVTRAGDTWTISYNENKDEGGGGGGGGGDGGGDGGECSEADAEAFPSDIEGDYDGGGGTGGWIGKEDDWDQKPFPSDDKDGPAPEDSERFPSKIGPCW